MSDQDQVVLEPAADGLPADRTPTRPSPVRRLIRAVFLLAALGACGWLVWRTRHDFLSALTDVSVAALALALVAVLAAAVVPVFGWRLLMSALGSDIPLAASARIYFVSQLGKYIPGSVWSVLAQVELSREFKVPVRRAGTVALLNLFLAAVGAVVVVAVALPFSTHELRHGYWWLALLLPPMLALVHPKVIGWWSRLLFRLLRREPEPMRLSGGAVVGSLGWMVLAWICYGLQFYVLVVAAAPADAPIGLPVALQCMGVFALAWVAGMLVVVLPAGAGVREVILVVGLSTVLPSGTALAVALISRVLLTLGDLLLAGLGAGYYRLQRRPVAL
jgi:glycosyltransferase 2 family protein